MSSPPTSSPSILSPQKLFPRESSNGKAMPPLSSSEEACTITTCVRVRPLYERSAPDVYAASSDHPRDQLRESASHMCIYRTSPTTLVVDQRMISSSVSKEKDISRDVTFSFDKVFWSIPPEQKTFLHPADVGAGSGKEYCSQQDVFEAIGQPAVDAAMQGINVCVFAFGQTGSGKSHTIFGTMPAVDGAGLAPRLATQLFHDLDRLKHRRNLTDAFLRTDSTDTAQSASSVSSQALGFSYTVAVGCLEIYNEKLTDLLAKSSSSTSHRLSTSGTLHQQHHHHRTSSNGINHSRVNSLHHLSIPPSPVLPSLPEEDVSFGDEDPHASPAVCMSRQSPVGTPDGGLFAAAHSMHPIGTTHSDDEVDDIFGGGAAQTFPSISNINAATSSHSGASSLRIRHDPTLGTYVEGLRAELVESEESLIALVQQALRHRVTASNHVHDQSSRSHAIMYITVTQEDKISGTRKVSTINLVDLAGSERGARNGAVGHQLVESKKINLSLTSLRRVIDLMIADPAKHRKNSGTPTPIGGGGGGVSTTSAGTHLPVRDSKLTEVMAESLGGNSKTSMIATVSPQERNIMETLDSLRYCSKAKGIVNRIKPNEERIAVAIQAIQHELERLGRELQWREDRHRFQEMSHFVQKRTNVVAALRITARERRTLCHTMRERCAQVSAELASCQGVLQARRVHADALVGVHQQLVDVTNMNNEVSAQLDAEQKHVDSLRELFNEAARDVAILEVTPLPPNVRKYLDAKKKCWRIACIHAAQELVIQREWDAQAARNQALKKECKALEEHLGVMDGLLDGATPEWASYRHFQQLLRNTAIALGMAHEGYHGNALDLRRGIAALQRQTIQLREGELRDAANDVQMVSSRCSEALSFSAGLICTLENGLDDAEEALRRVSTELASLASGCATMEGAIASWNASMRRDRIDAETLREHGAHLDRQYASVKASVLSLERDVSSDEAELCAIEVELRAVEQDIKTGDVTAQVFVQHIVDAEKAARTLCLPDAIPTIPDTPLARGVLSLDRSSAALLATTPRRIAGSLDRALIRSQSQDSRVNAMTSGTPKLRGTATSTYSRTPLAWRQSVTLTPTLKSTLRPSEVSPRPEAPVPHLYTEDF